jgi:hypothetical protein
LWSPQTFDPDDATIAPAKFFPQMPGRELVWVLVSWNGSILCWLVVADLVFSHYAHKEAINFSFASSQKFLVALTHLSSSSGVIYLVTHFVELQDVIYDMVS